jgi:P-type Cu+ transporter
MDNEHNHAASDIPAGTDKATDPVCGMTVAVKPDGRHAEFDGKTFHFCSEKCENKF